MRLQRICTSLEQSPEALLEMRAWHVLRSRRSQGGMWREAVLSLQHGSQWEAQQEARHLHRRLGNIRFNKAFVNEYEETSRHQRILLWKLSRLYSKAQGN
jgi:hypothetical protein